MFFRQDALGYINKLTDKNIEEGRKSPDNPYLLFKGSHGAKVGKLAALLAIDRHGSKARFIELSDVQEANGFLDEINRNLKAVLERSVLNEEEKRIEKWIWQAKGVIYRYNIKHNEPMHLAAFQTSFCGGYKCRNPYWNRVKEAILTQESDIEYTRPLLRYTGSADKLVENGVSTS